jgi:hypothetical protein
VEAARAIDQNTQPPHRLGHDLAVEVVVHGHTGLVGAPWRCISWAVVAILSYRLVRLAEIRELRRPRAGLIVVRRQAGVNCARNSTALSMNYT